MAKLKKINTGVPPAKDYVKWLSQIKHQVKNAQIKAATYVNAELIGLYWDMGKAIVEKQVKSKWGDGVMEQLSKDLMREFPEMKGFSLTNLKYIRKWYLFYTPTLYAASGSVLRLTQKSPQVVDQFQKSPQVVDQFQKSPQVVDQFQQASEIRYLLSRIPWGHNREIVAKCGKIEEALFYVTQTIQNNWSRSMLLLHIESNLYKRQGKAITNFKYTLPAAQSDLANEILKSPYNLNFLSLGKDAQERDMEQAIIANIKTFLLELGKGFAYVGNQFSLTIENDDFFLDLLFFNYRLNCFVIIELKMDEFKPEYAGKLNFYIQAVDRKIKAPEHKPTVGILLCRTPNKTVVEYSLSGLVKPVGVADYSLHSVLPQKLKNSLPSVEELQNELEKEVEELRNSSAKETYTEDFSKLIEYNTPRRKKRIHPKKKITHTRKKHKRNNRNKLSKPARKQANKKRR